eukprot:787293-Pelagomonas_calceolata.AAC.1
MKHGSDPPIVVVRVMIDGVATIAIRGFTKVSAARIEVTHELLTQRTKLCSAGEAYAIYSCAIVRPGGSACITQPQGIMNVGDATRDIHLTRDIYKGLWQALLAVSFSRNLAQKILLPLTVFWKALLVPKCNYKPPFNLVVLMKLPPALFSAGCNCKPFIHGCCCQQQYQQC